MLRTASRYSLVSAGWLGMLILGACEARERPQATGEAPAAAADTGVSPTTEPAPPAGQLTDANIVALLDEANAADSAAGVFARDKATPKGQQFDRTYIEQEVEIHRAVIDLAEQAHGTTQNDQLKALIEKAKPFLEKHLERAEQLQGKLGKAAA